MSAREELVTWLRFWDAGHAVALPAKLDALEREVAEKTLREAAETIREDSKSPLVQQDGKFHAGMREAADLIDPTGVRP
jgi:hypothetical protein